MRPAHANECQEKPASGGPAHVGYVITLQPADARLLCVAKALAAASNVSWQTALMEKFSLDAIARAQAGLAAAAPSGRSAETVYGGHEHALRQTVVALTAGSSLDEHESPGEATIQVLRGRVRLTAGDVAWEGRSGDLLVVPDRRHALEAIEESAVLLTVSKAT
jgi:quercetin dioxygenase-like cupin family protein